METILTVLNSLQIDSSFFVQFAIVCVLYFVLRSLFFGKLQEVLELREARTTKMESGANHKFQEAEKLAQEYKERIDKAKSEAFEMIKKRKEELENSEKEKIKALETKLESENSAKREEFQVEIDQKKILIMKEAENLSTELVNKIVQ